MIELREGSGLMGVPRESFIWRITGAGEAEVVKNERDGVY